MINQVGRLLPGYIEGYGKVIPFSGAYSDIDERTGASAKLRPYKPGQSKLLGSIREAIEKTGLRNGMTVSFHHHLRNGDKVVNMVMLAIADMGIKDIHLAASGIFPCHEPLVPLIESGVITKITTSTFNPGPVARAITAGKLRKPAVLMTHGGRARAIEAGDLHIDVAFIAAPSCDDFGNMSGSAGASACGCISYAYPDARFADTVVAVTDDLKPYPNDPAEISQEYVDYVVKVDSIGDPSGIVSGTTKITTDPVRLQIAEDTARLMDAVGNIRQDMSFQTGASGTSLAVAAKVRDRMLERGIQGSFGLGGIHAYFVQMLEAGLFRKLLDVQSFDLDAVASVSRNGGHCVISASTYANCFSKGCVVDKLDTVILGATEIDLDFNVNVVTGSTGEIIGASGGHSDCAAGSGLTIIVANLTRKNICVVREHVTTVTTPGETVDAIVTEYGIAINPRRGDLIEKLSGSDLPIVEISELKRIGEEKVGPQTAPKLTERVVGVVQYRDGSVIDLVYQPEPQQQ